VTVEVAPGKHC